MAGRSNVGDAEATTSQQNGYKSTSEIATIAMNDTHEIYDLIKHVHSSQAKLKISTIDKIESVLNRIRNSINSLEARAEAVKIPEQTMNQMIENVTKTVLEASKTPIAASYVQAVGHSKNATLAFDNGKPKIEPVIIKLTGKFESKGVEEMKKAIKEKIPEKKAIRVNWCKETTNKNAIIYVESRDDREVLEETIKHIPELVQIENKKKWPKIIIHGVSKQEKEELFLEEIINTNFPSTKPKDIKIRYKTGAKSISKNCSWIVELPPSCWRQALNTGRIYVGWQSYKVENYLSVPRCFLCQNFGHTTSKCRQDIATCFKCHGAHDSRNCTLQESKKCVNCVRKGMKNTEHNVSDKSCPLYIRAIEIEKGKTDYGHYHPT